MGRTLVATIRLASQEKILTLGGRLVHAHGRVGASVFLFPKPLVLVDGRHYIPFGSNRIPMDRPV